MKLLYLIKTIKILLKNNILNLIDNFDKFISNNYS